jgi:hypothetical protein
MNVSSRTPTATTSPMWSAITAGSTRSVANVAASTIPALVMTPPVTVSAERMPSRLPAFATSSRALVMRKIV